MQSWMVKCISVAVCLLLVASLASAAPSYPDYDNVRDLYELLLQKEALESRLQPVHEVVRKANRSPQLRLRFGRRADPLFQGSLADHNPMDSQPGN